VLFILSQAIAGVYTMFIPWPNLKRAVNPNPHVVYNDSAPPISSKKYLVTNQIGRFMVIVSLSKYHPKVV